MVGLVNSGPMSNECSLFLCLARLLVRFPSVAFLLTPFVASMFSTSACAQPILSQYQGPLSWIEGARGEPTDYKGLDDLIAKQPNQDFLVVGWAGFADAHVKYLVQLKKVNRLLIKAPSYTQNRKAFRLTAVGIGHLRELSELKTLGVIDIGLDDNSIEEIAKLTELTTLYLDCGASETAVKKLMNLKKLTGLTLIGPGTTDACAEGLAEFKSMELLSLRNSSITDKGLKHLASIPNLRKLDIDFSQVTDAGLKDLAAVKNLRYVSVRSTKVTPDGIEELWKNGPSIWSVNSSSRPDFNPTSPRNIEINWHWSEPNFYVPGETEKRLANTLAKQPNTKKIALGWPGMSDADLKDVIRLKRLSHLALLGATRYEPDGQKLEMKFSAMGWALLREATELRVLVVHGIPLDELSMVAIASSTQLVTLRLTLCSGNDAGVRHLANLKNLVALNLMASQITDVSLKELAALKKLQILSLHSTAVTDDGMKYLLELPELRRLYLGYTNVETGLKHVAACKKLKDLFLAGGKMTDAGLKELSASKSLRTLSLFDAAITDEGLKHLAAIKTLFAIGIITNKLQREDLTTVDLITGKMTVNKAADTAATKVTAEGLAWLRKARPEIKVHYQMN
jgi:internalin A